MNAYDSEFIQTELESAGFKRTDEPAEADTIIVNTCSIREHAEQRALSWLHDLSKFDADLIVCGCMAQRYGKELKDRVPRLNIVCGPDNYEELISIIKSGGAGDVSAVLDHVDSDVTYSLNPSGGRNTGVSRYLSITRGCENFCSYCVVPYLRGRLRSKEPGLVLDEIKSMVSEGVKEVTVLGQNVMAYSYGGTDFTSLAKMILKETSLPRLRFLTSHPRDVDQELFSLMSQEQRLCPHIHLPLQSGSDRILELMGRGYTRQRYLSILEQARSVVPDLSVTTDIIVGFPTETDADFDDTMEVVDRACFDSAFTFKYSPREGTRAFVMEDDVSVNKKKERLSILNDRIKNIRRGVYEGLLGSNFQILLDGKVKKRENQYFKGRTPHFRNVIVEPRFSAEGEIVEVNLEKLVGFTFTGRPIGWR